MIKTEVVKLFSPQVLSLAFLSDSQVPNTIPILLANFK